MGWSSGSRLFDSVIEAIQPRVESLKVRETIYEDIIDAFMDMDWDTLDECVGEDIAYDNVYNKKYPEEDE